MIQTVKLAKLILSDINVRKASDDLIEQFAADIAARGVLQNLIVTPAKKPRGTFAIIAGSRRYRALTLPSLANLLAAEGLSDILIAGSLVEDMVLAFRERLTAAVEARRRFKPGNRAAHAPPAQRVV